MPADVFTFDAKSVRRISDAVHAHERNKSPQTMGPRPPVNRRDVYWFAAVQTVYAGASDNPERVRVLPHGDPDTCYAIQVPTVGETLGNIATDAGGVLYDGTLDRNNDGTPKSLTVGSITYPVFPVDFSAADGRPFQGDIFPAVNNGGDWFAFDSHRRLIRAFYKTDGFAWTVGGSSVRSGYSSDALANSVYPYLDPFGLDTGSSLVEDDEICIEWGTYNTDAGDHGQAYLLTYARCAES